MLGLLMREMIGSYREWLLELAGREAEDCRRLRGVLSERPQVFAEATRAWQPARRRALLLALTKTCKLGIDPLPPTAEELNELGKWSWSPSERNVAHMRAALLVGISRGEFRVNRRELRKVLRRVLGAALGPPSKRPGEMCFVSKLDGVTVNTFVDTGGWWQLRYWHTVARGAFDEPVPLVNEAILLSHAGISHLVGENMSHWDAMTDADIGRVAEHLAGLCTEFVEAVPEIVQRTSSSLVHR